MRANSQTATIFVIFSFIIGMLSLYDRLRAEEDTAQLTISKTYSQNDTDRTAVP